MNAGDTVRLLTCPAAVVTGCFSTLDSLEKYVWTGILLVFRKFEAPSCDTTNVIRSPLTTPVVLEANPFILKAALVPEVVNAP